jgi:pyruvate/2-oxoglutarate dehydrogenase complex dihydrolipoamide dehydrogenase (E3) component
MPAGKNRVEAIETVKVDDCLNPVAGTEEMIECDSVLLSVGLIPENELSKKAGVLLDPLTGGPIVDENMATNVAGIFSAGNVVTIYDLVDYVSKAGFIAGKNAAMFAAGQAASVKYVEVKAGDGVRTVIPQKITIERGTSQLSAEILFELRVTKEYPEKISVDIMDGANVIASHKEKYARPAEMITMKVDWNDLTAKLSKDTAGLVVKIS